MCKLFLATGPLKQQTLKALLAEINDEWQLSQRDGFGFLARGKTADSIAWGRYLSPQHYPGFGAKGALPEWLTPPMDEQGTLPHTAYSLLAHGRTATSKVCLENVHPFRQDKLFLAHNGILRWTGAGVGPIAPNGCDSEEFFQWLTRGGGTWKTARDNWGGSGAIIVTDIDSGITVVAQDDANLHMAKRRAGGWVLSTWATELETICRKANVQLAIKPLKVPRKLIYFGPEGEIIGDTDWQGFGAPGFVSQYDRDRVYNNETPRSGTAAFFAQDETRNGTNGHSCNPKGFQPDIKRLPVRTNGHATTHKVIGNGQHGPATTAQVLGSVATQDEIEQARQEAAAELATEQKQAIEQGSPAVWLA